MVIKKSDVLEINLFYNDFFLFIHFLLFSSTYSNSLSLSLRTFPLAKKKGRQASLFTTKKKKMSNNANEYLDDVSLQTPTYVSVPLQAQQTIYARKDDQPSQSTGGFGRGYSWGAYICIFLFVVFGIFAIISSVSLDKANNNQHELNSYIEQWHQAEEERNAHAELSTKTIAMEGEKRAITLCARQSYHTIQDKLVPLTESIESIKSPSMKDHSFYHINVRMRLYLETRDTSSKKDKRQLTISYNVTSSFKSFSTIQLEELEFSAIDHSVGPMRTIVLCSNNEEIDVERCDASIKKKHTLILRGEEVVPLIISPLSNSIRKEGMQDIEPTDEDEDDEEQTTEKRQPIGLRMYNIVFYESEANGTSKAIKEHRSVTLEPLQC